METEGENIEFSVETEGEKAKSIVETNGEDTESNKLYAYIVYTDKRWYDVRM